MKQMQRSLALCMAFAGLLLLPDHAFAQDAITGIDISVHATFSSVGIQVTVSGDDNRNGSVGLEISEDGSEFGPAHALSRVDAARLVGSAFFLEPGTAFDVRVTLEDADGVTNGVLEASGRTRSKIPPEATERTIHVDPDGRDEGTGDESNPYQTLGYALGWASAGSLVLLHEGEYHESIELYEGGTEGAPLMIRAFGDGPAVLTGFDPGLMSPAVWTDEGGGVYSAAAPETRYVAAGGIRLWMYVSVSDLRSLSSGLDGGFACEGGRVYVILPGGVSPSETTVMVSVFGRALWLEGAPDVVIDGLVIRGYGAEQYSEGIMVRDGSHDVWIINCVFENNMPGIWVKNEVDDLVVMGNEFSDRGLGDFPWHPVKERGGMESGAISIDGRYDGQGIIFQDNYVHDMFDGLNICGNDPMDHPNNADVINNTVFHCGDDGIETDGECSNIRIIGNRFQDCLVGVSTAPAVTGPTYIIRNLMVDLNNVAPDSEWGTRAVKFNVGDERPSGQIFIYHNTASTFEEGNAAFNVTDDSRWISVKLLNNIWMGTEYAFYFNNSGDEPFSQDYDLLHTTDPERWVRYQGERYLTPEDYFSGAGRCGRCIKSLPGFVNAAGGDYSLEEGSGAVDRGVLIPGVNDDFEDEGPDMGAIEQGGSITPPDPVPEAEDTVEPYPDRPPADASTDITADTAMDAGDDPAGDPESEGDDGSGSGCGCSISR